MPVASLPRPRAAGLAWCRGVAGAGLLSCWLSAGADAALPLSLREAQRLAALHSLALPAQADAAMAARERAVAAGQWPDPVLRLGLDNLPFEGSSEHRLTREPATARSIGLVQALPDGDKLLARRRIFEREADLALARGALERRNLQREAGLSWLALRAEVERLALIDAQRGEAQLLREVADLAWRAGRGQQTDLFVARTALARLDDLRLQAEGRRASALVTLQRWVGAAAERPLGDAPSWALAPPAADPADPALLEADPELRLAAAREAAAGAAAGLASADRHADWSVDLRFQQRGPRFDNMLTVGLSIPLRWDLANRQERELAARLAQQRQAQADTEELRRARDAERRRWHERWRTARARLALLDAQLMPLAAARAQVALSAYRAGSGALPAVLEARVAEAALRLDRVQLELDAASDWLRLDALLPNPEISP